MNQQEKDKWIAALRSGDYKQLRGSMSDGNAQKPSTAFCCLGVAMKVFHGWDHGQIKTPAGAGAGRGLSLDDRIPERLCDEFTPAEFRGIVGTWADFFIVLNDKLGWTFPQIADWAEKYLEVSP